MLVGYCSHGNGPAFADTDNFNVTARTDRSLERDKSIDNFNQTVSGNVFGMESG